MTYAFDPELVPWLDMLPDVKLDAETLISGRARSSEIRALLPPYEPVRALDVTDVEVPGPDGAPDVRVRIYAPRDRDGLVPGLLYIHGGGFVMGDVVMYESGTLRLADELGIVIVSVDYRLAPEHPFPAPVEDCYAALEWMSAKAAELGVDPDRLGIAGDSAGGGLAAGTTLMACDRGGPRLCFQYLGVPELDDRLDTPSMQAYVDTPLWNRLSAIFSWTAYLGNEPGGEGVSPYAAPARAEDLSGLPPTWVSVCQYDPLRDEGIAYAQRLLHAGVMAELHCYPGTFHGSALIDSAVTRRMFADEVDALRRGLQL